MLESYFNVLWRATACPRQTYSTDTRSPAQTMTSSSDTSIRTVVEQRHVVSARRDSKSLLEGSVEVERAHACLFGDVIQSGCLSATDGRLAQEIDDLAYRGALSLLSWVLFLLWPTPFALAESCCFSLLARVVEGDVGTPPRTSGRTGRAAV